MAQRSHSINYDQSWQTPGAKLIFAVSIKPTIYEIHHFTYKIHSFYYEIHHFSYEIHFFPYEIHHFSYEIHYF